MKKIFAFAAVAVLALLLILRLPDVGPTLSETTPTPTAEEPMVGDGESLAMAPTEQGVPAALAEVASGPAQPQTASARIEEAARDPLPLPPIGTPVAEVFDSLKARADRGDASASCRLAQELQRCSEAVWVNSMSTSVENDLARQPATPPGVPETLARMRNSAANLGVGCEGLSDEQRSLAFDYQMRAAEARPDLRLWAALNPALDPQNFVNDLDRWQQYKSKAMTWMEQAATSGDLSAVIALQRVHGDLRRNGPPYPRFRIRDDERFVMYTQLLSRYGIDFAVVKPEFDARRAQLDAAALARIDARVTSLYRSDVPPMNPLRSGEALRDSIRFVPRPGACEAM